MSDTAFVVIVPAGAPAVPGADAQRLPDLAFWDTPAVHGWLQAIQGQDAAGVRVVAATEADLIPEGVDRLEVPVSAEEAAAIAQACATPAAAQAQAELVSFRRMIAQRPAMVNRARAAGLSPVRIEQLSGIPLGTATQAD